MALRFPTHSHGQIVVLQCTEGELGKRRKRKAKWESKGDSEVDIPFVDADFPDFPDFPFPLSRGSGLSLPCLSDSVRRQANIYLPRSHETV